MQQHKRTTDPEYHRKRRQRLTDAGLCIACGKVKEVPESSRCAACKKRQLSYRRTEDHKRRLREDRQKRIERGLCAQCNTPAIPGQTQCVRHKEIRDRYNAKARRAKSKRLADVGYVPRPQSVVKAGVSPNAWWKSFDYLTAVTVWELEEVQNGND